ncbi:MAG TPA: lipopolysaccharide heptosyltransferase I [Thermoanaerobaculia bacterium]|nr:lipopolysaccharide heptosyltransferase I [Thermoanaerobaculia bacterium]
MNLLLIRTSALGDLVHTLPVLSALRRHLPEARIAWVVERVFAPLLEGHADLDQVLPVGLREWRERPFGAATRRELAAFRRALRAFRADVALDLMGNHKAGAIARLSGARRRIGLAGAERREPSSALWLTETAPARGEHAVERALAVVARLGVPAEEPDFGGDKLLAGAPSPAGEAGALPGEERPFALLHPGAAWGNKVYPPERWARVARGLAEAAGLDCRVALSPSPAERELAGRIVAASGGAARPAEAADLPALVAWSRRARLVLGGDTGPVHLAHALGTPVVCLMGPTDPARHGPYGAPERALARRLPCSYCYRRFDSTKACLLEIPPRAVVERALAILLDSPAKP